MDYYEIVEKLRNGDIDDLMDDLYNEAILYDTDIETLLDFDRYGWDATHVARSLCEDFPNRYHHE